MTTTNVSYGSNTALTVTGLSSLASSQTVGWQSDVIDNTSTKADDYLVSIKLAMANTAGGNDKAAYLYLCPVYYDGSTNYYTDGGTATLPSGSNGSYTIALPNDLVPLTVLNYATTNMTMQKTVSIAAVTGGIIPKKFSFIVVNYTGAAVSSSAINLLPVTFTSA